MQIGKVEVALLQQRDTSLDDQFRVHALQLIERPLLQRVLLEEGAGVRALKLGVDRVLELCQRQLVAVVMILIMLVAGGHGCDRRATGVELHEELFLASVGGRDRSGLLQLMLGTDGHLGLLAAALGPAVAVHDAFANLLLLDLHLLAVIPLSGLLGIGVPVADHLGQHKLAIFVLGNLMLRSELTGSVLAFVDIGNRLNRGLNVRLRSRSDSLVELLDGSLLIPFGKGTNEASLDHGSDLLVLLGGIDGLDVTSGLGLDEKEGVASELRIRARGAPVHLGDRDTEVFVPVRV
mmetsp:Transcript_9839/g.22562  ORF Transcript_9839/g.22562 Transcript_9839/m.22562 type:complete len:293 (-) Transcript_9839:278-1156(-)